MKATETSELTSNKEFLMNAKIYLLLLRHIPSIHLRPGDDRTFTFPCKHRILPVQKGRWRASGSIKTLLNQNGSEEWVHTDGVTHHHLIIT